MSAKRLTFLTIWQKPSQHHQQMHPETVDGKKQPHTSSLAYLNQKQVLSETFEVNLSRWSTLRYLACYIGFTMLQQIPPSSTARMCEAPRWPLPWVENGGMGPRRGQQALNIGGLGNAVYLALITSYDQEVAEEFRSCIRRAFQQQFEATWMSQSETDRTMSCSLHNWENRKQTLNTSSKGATRGEYSIFQKQ